MKQSDKIIKLIVKEVENIPKLAKSFDYSNPLQKYSLEEYLNEIIYVLKTGISWRDLKTQINWNSIYKVFRKLVSYKIMESCYQRLLDKYLSKSTQSKLKFILTDTSFIPNKKGHDVTGYNYYYNRKKGTKISAITDSHGIPLDVKCYSGNRYDSKLLDDHLNKIAVTHPIKNHHIDKENNRYFLADAGYDSKVIREKLINLGYTPKIPINKRNHKTKKLPKITAKDKKIYKKRLKIENMFKRIKDNRRVAYRYDCKISVFMTFIYLALIKMLC